MSGNVNIIDVTIRQGGFLVHNHLLKEQVADIAKGLEEAGIEFVEVSHGRGIGAKRAGYPGLFSDAGLLEAARKAAPKLKFTAYVSPHAYSIFELEKVAKLCEWLRLSVDLDEMPKSLENLEAIQKVGGQAMVLLERAHRLSPAAVAEQAKALEGAGAKVLYLADTFSSMNAEDVKSYFGALKEKSSLPLGFQGFNATGQATANCLAASESGASWLDGSLLGMGPAGGMPTLEILAALAPRLGLKAKLDLHQLCRAGRWYALPAVRRLPSLRTIDLLMSRLKLDYYPSEFLERLAGILEMNPEDLLKSLAAQKGDRLRLKEIDLREFLASQNIDFGVIVEYMKTGKIPGAEAAS